MLRIKEERLKNVRNRKILKTVREFKIIIKKLQISKTKY